MRYYVNPRANLIRKDRQWVSHKIVNKTMLYGFSNVTCYNAPDS